MKNSDLFWAIQDMDEAFIQEAQEWPERKEKRTGNLRPLRMGLIAAILIILLAGSVQALLRYNSSTDYFSDWWVNYLGTEMSTEQKDYVEQYGAVLGESVTDQGITITFDSVTCTDTHVNMMFLIQGDPELYPEESFNWSIELFQCEAENSAWGSSTYSSGVGNMLERAGEYWSVQSCDFLNLPDGARLNDGDTTLRMEITGVTSGTGTTVKGNWVFSVELPDGAASVVRTAPDAVFASGDMTLAIRDITLTDGTLSMAVTKSGASNSGYRITGAVNSIEQIRSAEPERLILSVEAQLSDGTIMFVGSGGMRLDQETMVDHWTFNWGAPLDVTEISAVFLSDGKTTLTIVPE